MFIHSDILTAAAIRECVPEGCYLAGHYAKGDPTDWASIHQYGSRSRHIAYGVRLSGSSRYVMQKLPDKSATWDEWGIFIAAIFDRDPNAIAGDYKSYDNFIEATLDEYERINKNRSDLRKWHKVPWLDEDHPACPSCGSRMPDCAEDCEVRKSLPRA